jgi:hypothetical protein
MSFSYTLFLALLLIAPGLAVWAGFRIGERDALLSQAPEKPGSTLSLLIIVFGALAGHILMSGLFVVQTIWCSQTRFCLPLSFDPNVYRVILTNKIGAEHPDDSAFVVWFTALLVPALLTGVFAWWASGWRWVRAFRENATFGWLRPLIDEARSGESFIVAYVVTTLEHNGANVAYEGIVENVALDDNRAISMLVLKRCDRFLVRITSDNVERIDTTHQSIPLIQLEAKNFVNVALEVFVDSISEGTDPSAADNG